MPLASPEEAAVLLVSVICGDVAASALIFWAFLTTDAVVRGKEDGSGRTLLHHSHGVRCLQRFRIRSTRPGVYSVQRAQARRSAAVVP